MSWPGADGPGEVARLRLDLRRRLGAFALDVAVDLPLAGVTALFGPSGSGKSTLIALLAGLLRPDDGRIEVGATLFFDAARGIDRPVEQRALGVVFQDARLFPHRSVRANLEYGWRRAGPRAAAPIARFAPVVDLLGLGALLERRPHTLSGGERQRVAIGRALLAQPRLLLMDEPLASLDPARKSEVLPYIERLRDEFAVPIVYVSHSTDEVLRLATALAVLDGGRLVAAGELGAVIAQPAAAAYLGAGEVGVLVYATVLAHDARYALSTLAADGFTLRVPQVDAPPGTPLRLRIRAREVALALAPPADLSISNRLGGTIEALRPCAAGQGAHVDVTVRVGPATRLLASVTRESAERLALAPGLRCWCLVKSIALDAGALGLAQGRAAQRA